MPFLPENPVENIVISPSLSVDINIKIFFTLNFSIKIINYTTFTNNKFVI